MVMRAAQGSRKDDPGIRPDSSRHWLHRHPNVLGRILRDIVIMSMHGDESASNVISDRRLDCNSYNQMRRWPEVYISSGITHGMTGLRQPCAAFGAVFAIRLLGNANHPHVVQWCKFGLNALTDIAELCMTNKQAIPRDMLCCVATRA